VDVCASEYQNFTKTVPIGIHARGKSDKVEELRILYR
jgi:hypothetical protein